MRLPVGAAVPEWVLTDVEYQAICQLVYNVSGLVLEAARRDVVETHLRDRREELVELSPRNYLQRLILEPDELRLLIDAITINETYFFRDAPQLAVFSSVLSELVTDKLDLPYARLRIWSAACSVGCEPYTLAILINEEFERRNCEMDWKITASDISPSCLKVAQSALYTERELRDVPPAIMARYFRQTGRFWQFHHPCQSRVHFTYSNLMQPGSEVRGAYDIIFCRNALIYFDDCSRRQVADLLYDSLVSGGHVFLGASESMARMSRAFELRRVGAGFVYFKPSTTGGTGS